MTTRTIRWTALIGATARAEGLALVTRDENIRKSPLLKTIW